MAKQNFVQYAESTLGVHTTWEQANDAVNHHEKLVMERAKLQVSIRNLQSRMSDREADVLIDARAKYHELSATAFQQVGKEAIHQDEAHRTMRAEMLELRSNSDVMDAAVSSIEKRLSVLTGRLEELGGLLHFYAVNKSVSP